MRKLLSPALAAGLLLIAPALVRADDSRAVIEKAIKAYGGEEKLARLKAVQLSAKGTINLGAEVPFTLETVWQWPDRLRNTVKLGTTTVVEAMAGDESWSIRDGKPAPLSAAKLDELRAQAHVRRL